MIREHSAPAGRLGKIAAIFLTRERGEELLARRVSPRWCSTLVLGVLVGLHTIPFAFLEVVSDALGSIGVIIAGLIMLTTGWYDADPFFSVLKPIESRGRGTIVLLPPSLLLAVGLV